MNILILSPFFPYPANQGGKIRVFNLIKYLARRNRVTLACLTSEPVSDYGPLGDYCEKIVCIHRPPRTARDLIWFLMGRMPYNYLRYSSISFHRALSDLCETHRFDAVQVEFPMLWQYADALGELPMVLSTHNIEYHLIQDLRLRCRNPLKKMLYKIEEKRFRRQEETAWKDARLCFTVSEKEKEVVTACSGDADKVLVVPNGVDLETFVFQPKAAGESRILFLGGMDWAPNLDAAIYFLEDILPRVRKEIPDLKIDFVGKDLWKIKERIKLANIELHENVPEILPWFHRADVLAVPLRMGAGTRIKILESMAAGLPIVSTSKGCEGTEVVSGKHLLVADSAQAFADQLICLVRDKSLAARLAQEARRLIEQMYSWEMAADKIHEALHHMHQQMDRIDHEH